MRLDYSDKVGALRESSERRPVQKNRPRKEPIGALVLGAFLLLVVGYGAGVLTGWFLFKGKQTPQAASAAPAAQPTQQPAPQAAQPGAAQSGQPVPEVPLTFYKTLPSGGRGVIGSGMNVKLQAAPGQPKAVPAASPAQPNAAPAPAAPAAKAGDQKQPADKAPAEKPSEKPAAEKQAADNPAAEKQKQETRYLVQVASYRDKQEAESVRSKLTAKGVAAYLVESKVQDKGVWYRIRVGRHLSKQEAQQLAGKVGGGAAVLPE